MKLMRYFQMNFFWDQSNTLYVNYLANQLFLRNILIMEEEIFSDLKHYFCNDHLFYRWVSDQIIRFVSQKEEKKLIRVLLLFFIWRSLYINQNWN